MLRVCYPRIIFRTSRAAAALLVLEFTMALTAVAMLAARSSRPVADLVLLAVFVSLPSLLAFRILRVLRELERQRPEPDEAMVLLFDLSLMLPLISLVYAAYLLNNLR